MAKTKLTLSVDREIVNRAKEFADKHDTSVSALVEDFLRRLDGGARWPAGERAPIVARLRGIGAPSGGREEYRRRLEEKYR